MTRINVENPMREACHEGISSGYVPIFRGQELEVEGQIPEVSLRNLRVLSKSGIYPLLVEVCKDQVVFFVFSDGSCYAATGFSTGCRGPALNCFAQALIMLFEQPEDSLRDWKVWLQSLPEDFQGRINPADMTGMDLRIHGD